MRLLMSAWRPIASVTGKLFVCASRRPEPRCTRKPGRCDRQVDGLRSIAEDRRSWLRERLALPAQPAHARPFGAGDEAQEGGFAGPAGAGEKRQPDGEADRDVVQDLFAAIGFADAVELKNIHGGVSWQGNTVETRMSEAFIRREMRATDS